MDSRQLVINFFSLIWTSPQTNIILYILVKCVRSRPQYFADRLYHSMKGIGTDDTTLVRVVASRCEVGHCC